MNRFHQLPFEGADDHSTDGDRTCWCNPTVRVTGEVTHHTAWQVVQKWRDKHARALKGNRDLREQIEGLETHVSDLLADKRRLEERLIEAEREARPALRVVEP